eukprot:353457-Chlamydomonas_euryale.AAC.5
MPRRCRSMPLARHTNSSCCASRSSSLSMTGLSTLSHSAAWPAARSGTAHRQLWLGRRVIDGRYTYGRPLSATSTSVAASSCTHTLESGSTRRPLGSVAHSAEFSTSTAGSSGRKNGPRPAGTARRSDRTRCDAYPPKSVPGGVVARPPCVSASTVRFHTEPPNTLPIARSAVRSSGSTRYRSSRSTYSTTSMGCPPTSPAIFASAA